MAGVHGLQHVECLTASTLAHDDAVGTHAEAVLDEALDRLKAVDAKAVEIVHLRYFVGLSNADAAQILGIAPRTADRIWAFARAWLHQEIAGTDAEN